MNWLVCYILYFIVTIVKSDCPNGVSPTTTSGIYYTRDTTFCSGDLIFEDNFENFDLARWQHENTLSGGGNWEFEYYSNNRSNSYVENGHLHIKPTYLTDDVSEDFLYSGTLDVNGGLPADSCTNAANYGCSRTGSSTNILNPIKSARIRTSDSFSFKYGSVVVRAKMPAGDWLWPAIWLMPRYNSYGVWPQSGEIDLIESRGNKNLATSAGVNVGTQQISSTLHWGPNYFFDEWNRTHFEKNNAAGYDADFHLYKLVWGPDGMTIYIDNEQIGAVTPPSGGFWDMGLNDCGQANPWKGGTKMAPFDQEFYLIINLAVGGINFFSDELVNPGGKPWSNTSPTVSTDFWKAKQQWESTWNLGTDDSHLIVDYVQVYAI